MIYDVVSKFADNLRHLRETPLLRHSVFKQAIAAFGGFLLALISTPVGRGNNAASTFLVGDDFLTQGRYVVIFEGREFVMGRYSDNDGNSTVGNLVFLGLFRQIGKRILFSPNENGQTAAIGTSLQKQKQSGRFSYTGGRILKFLHRPTGRDDDSKRLLD